MAVEPSEQVFERLREIVEPLDVEYGMLRVGIFGSRARGDHGPDINFCVLTGEDCGMFELAGFYSELKNAVGTEIDLVCEDELDDGFRENIKKEMRILYEARCEDEEDVHESRQG